MSNIKQISEFSIYTALAFIFGYLETLIPLPVPFPGMKLGLANLIVMITLYKKNFHYALGISCLRTLLCAFTFGSLFSFLYSIAGAILSLVGMTLMKKWGDRYFSILSVSALGGILHNTGQLLVAGFLVGFGSILWYAPLLYFCGLITGVIIGIFAGQCLQRLLKFRF